jgi:hypothetical protein
MKDLCVITYTTSKYKDVWPMHFGQLSKHLHGIKSYVLSDHGSGELFDFKEHKLIEHDDSDPYWKQYTDALKVIPERYVIYLQEDFIMFAKPNTYRLQRYKEVLDQGKYDYVRLIRCGYQTPLDRPAGEDLYEVHMETNDAFSMQATMWNKERLHELYTRVKSEKWLEAEHWNIGCRELNIRGVFCYNGEQKIGSFHYDSLVWPYVCTAINRGKWNIDQYPQTMKEMFETYSIDPNVRGIRKR